MSDPVSEDGTEITTVIQLMDNFNRNGSYPFMAWSATTAEYLSVDCKPGYELVLDVVTHPGASYWTVPATAASISGDPIGSVIGVGLLLQENAIEVLRDGGKSEIFRDVTRVMALPTMI